MEMEMKMAYLARTLTPSYSLARALVLEWGCGHRRWRWSGDEGVGDEGRRSGERGRSSIMLSVCCVFTFAYYK